MIVPPLDLVRWALERLAAAAREAERARGGAGEQAGAAVQREPDGDSHFYGLEGLLEPEQTTGVCPAPIAAKCARGVWWRRREHLPPAAAPPRPDAVIGSEPTPPTEGGVGNAWSSSDEEGPYVCPGCYAVAEPCCPGCLEVERRDRFDDGDRESPERELGELDLDDDE